MNDLCESPSTPGREIERTYQEKLNDRRTALQKELDDVDNALKLLEKNPEVLKVLDALAKVQRRL
jgi:hypothetical protein